MPARSAQGTLRRFLRFENSHIGVVYTYKEHPRNSRSWALPGRVCHRHGGAHACTGARGNLYRFVEPAVLLLLKKGGVLRRPHIRNAVECQREVAADRAPRAAHRRA
jgi:hypothetical protein